MISELITKCRSYRRFDSERKISREELLMMVDAARRSASTANLQRLRFALVNDKEDTDKIFENLAFAGYLKEWKGPKCEERPTAYIIMMTEKTPDVNMGIDMAGYLALSRLKGWLSMAAEKASSSASVTRHRFLDHTLSKW